MLGYSFDKLPFVSMTGKTKETRGWSHTGRTMPVNMLVVIHDGSCTFRMNKKEYKYKAGDAALVPANTFYSPHTDSFCEYTFFHFNGDFAEYGKDELPPQVFENAAPDKKPIYGFVESTDALLLFDYKMTVSEWAQEINLLLRKCANIQYTYENKAQLLLSLRFSEMMFFISQAYSEQFKEENRLPPAANRIISYIKDNYTRAVTLNDICTETGISKQYCMRVFKKYMHTTVNSYILDLRMRYAAYLLRRTYMNVNQTADYLGFSSVSYFSRVFKKYYGIPPSEYFE